MKALFLSLSLCFISTLISLGATPLSGLVKRTLPQHESAFVFKQEITDNELDYFEITSQNGKICIKGNSLVSLATGYNWYLKYYCNVSFSWCGNQCTSPSKLPMVKNVIRMETPLKVGFYLNYCTFSYSMAAWGWNEWEREIDRMAMNGITTPMALVGVENVWRNTLKRFGYTEQEITCFLPGPAYLGWFMMGNLEGMGGPLPASWFDRQEQLQKKIVARMKEYGMTPVFQSFFGMVPSSLSTKFPEADIIGQGQWLNFNRPPILNPIDPLFDKMATVWYEEYEKLFGTVHYYAGDLFHEGGKTESIDVAEAATRVQEAMNTAVPNSVWVIQSWGGNPTKELLSGLVKEQTLVIDLCAEYWSRWKESGAFGEFPWVWGNITNWGGNIGLHGRLEAISQEPIKACNDTIAGRWMKGIANVPEGIGTNPIAFDLACEMRWRKSVPNLDEWLHNYACYRYGKANDSIDKAWSIFAKTAYGTYKGHRRPSESIFCARPSLRIHSASAWGSIRIYYHPAAYEEGVRLFVSQKDKFRKADAYEYDLVDFTRQMLANKGRILYNKVVKSYKNKQQDSVSIYSDKFLRLILLQDELLSYRKELCLSTWTDSFKAMSTEPADKELFEYNAKALITVWASEKSQLLDYAHREWSGLLRTYYYPRWVLFFDWMKQSLKNVTVKEPHYDEMEWVHRKINEQPRQRDLYHVVDECMAFK